MEPLVHSPCCSPPIPHYALGSGCRWDLPISSVYSTEKQGAPDKRLPSPSACSLQGPSAPQEPTAPHVPLSYLRSPIPQHPRDAHSPAPPLSPVPLGYPRAPHSPCPSAPQPLPAPHLPLHPPPAPDPLPARPPHTARCRPRSQAQARPCCAHLSLPFPSPPPRSAQLGAVAAALWARPGSARSRSARRGAAPPGASPPEVLDSSAPQSRPLGQRAAGIWSQRPLLAGGRLGGLCAVPPPASPPMEPPVAPTPAPQSLTSFPQGL